MTCQYVKHPAHMHSDTLQDAEDAGLGVVSGEGRKVRGTAYDFPVEESWWWYCGEGEMDQCRCGAFSDFLCDYPVGKGKTCDLPLCDECRRPAGKDLDFCLVHAAEFKRKSGLSEIREWPPARAALEPRPPLRDDEKPA